MSPDLLKQVAPVSELHHDAERLCRLLEECLLVRNDVGVLDRGQDADLIESSLFLALGELSELDFLHCVLLVAIEAAIGARHCAASIRSRGA